MLLRTLFPAVFTWKHRMDFVAGTLAILAFVAHANGQGQPLVPAFPPNVVISKREPTAEKPAELSPELAATLKLQESLRKPLNFNFENHPLNEFLRSVSQQTGVQVVIDQRALEGAGIAVQAPITINEKQMPADQALAQVLRPLQLTKVMREGYVSITTIEDAENSVQIRVFDVVDILSFEIRDGKPAFNPQFLSPAHGGGIEAWNLRQIIRVACGQSRPGWVEHGGVGTIQIHPLGLLIIQTTDEVLKKVEQTLDALRRLQTDYRTNPISAALKPYRMCTLQDIEESNRVREKLKQTISVKFEDEELRHWVAKLTKKCDVKIRLDERALEGAGISLETRVRLQLDNVSLRSVLRESLSPLGLTYLMRNGVILVTTIEEEENSEESIIYPLRDYFNNFFSLPIENSVAEDFEPIISAVRLTASPKPGWPDGSGPQPGIIELYSHKALIVTQTWQVHEEIEKLLEDLRRTGDRIRRSVNVERKPTISSGTFILTRDELGKTKTTAEEFAKAVKQLLSDVKWNEAGAEVHTFSDRVVIRHHPQVIFRIGSLTRNELSGWAEEPKRKFGGGMFGGGMKEQQP